MHRRRLALAASSALLLASRAMATPLPPDDIFNNQTGNSVTTARSVDGWLIVGQNLPGTSLTLQSGGSYGFRVLSIGDQTGANGNTVTVTGAGSSLANISGFRSVTGPALVVGTIGTGNQLLILGGAQVNITHVDGGSSPDDVHVGYTATATGNRLSVSGAGSALHVDASTIYVGFNAGGNSLEVLNGGSVTALQMRVGGGTANTGAASNNSVLVDGAGSSLTTQGSFNLGANGGTGLDRSGNTLTVSNGATASIGLAAQKNLTVGQSDTSLNNVVTVTGAGSLLTAYSIVVGNGTNTGNALEVAAQGRITSATGIALSNASQFRYGVGGSAGALASAAGAITIGSGVGFTAYLAPSLPLLSHNQALHGASVSGSFSSLNTSGLPQYLVASLRYTATDVYLDLASNLGGGLALSGNQRSVAGGLNNAFNNGGSLPLSFLPLYSLGAADLRAQLTRLSGEAATGAQQSAFQLTNGFLGLLSDPFAAELGVAGRGAPAGSAVGRLALWGAAFGGYTSLNGNQAAGSQRQTGRDAGFVVGADYLLAPQTRLGVAVGGAGGNWSVANGLGSGRSDAMQVGLYGNTRLGAAYLSGALGFTNNWATTTRNLAGDRLKGEVSSQTYAGRVEAGYRLPTGSLGVTPYAAVQVQNYHAPAYAEAGGAGGGLYALAFNGRSVADTRSELGLRLDEALPLGGGQAVKLRLRAAWVHDFSPAASLNAAFTNLPGSGFRVVGAARARNAALASAGLDWKLTDSLSLSTTLGGEFSGQATSYNALAALRLAW